MSLEPGYRLDHYQIEEIIGKGGMGEVYRATDTRLPREVAIKTSQQKFSERFAREAKVIATLNHPNICTLFDIGTSPSGFGYLVMEMIEGPTLSEHMKSGALSLDETSTIMRQVADALDYAHEKGVVHRDLKPGNIKIRPDGVVKVLDFGLAKVTSTVAPASRPENPDDSPTMTMGETQAGVVLGTAAYMAPEQAMGRLVDKRADVFAFGVVFYEMLTGARMHKGDSVQEVMASVLKDEPDLTRIPAQAHRLIKRCLEKDPNKRLRHVGDVLALLDDAPISGSQTAIAPLPPEAPKKKWLWPAIAAGALVAGAALSLWAPWKKAAPTQAVRFEVGPSEKMTFINGAAMAVSPDGRWMVFNAAGENGQRRYYIRALDGVEVRALPGTEGPAGSRASWSYDSRWVLFSNSRGNGQLKKVDIQGGPPQNISDFPDFLVGAGWNSDGVIIVGSGGQHPILRVPASGGQATPLTVLAPGERSHRWPQFLPDGKHFLYLRVSSDAAKSGVYIGSLDAKPEQQSTQLLLVGDRQAYYAPSAGGGTGHLIFLRGATLMAQPFDPNKMTLSGEPVAIADGVDSFPAQNEGLFSLSNTGTLVYRGGSGSQSVLNWFDQHGNPAGALGEPGVYANPAISPDGSRVAVGVGPAASRDIWILDVARGTSTRFTFDPARDDYPAWSPDGKYIAFSSNRGGQSDLYIKPADGSGEEKLLLKTDEPKIVERWTRDGRFLLFDSRGPKTAFDIWALPFPGEAKPVSLLQTQFSEDSSRVSPDGRWLAYDSDESGTYEIYVRPFTPEAPAGTGAKWLVSKGTGIYPIWRPDGKELFYVTLAGQVMSVDIDAGKGFQADTPKRIFTAPSTGLPAGWDLSPDGKRFLFAAPPNTGRTIPYTVVLNWAAGLKK
jgi:serine/threonine protein kinase/Tol biopolymer transport system component